MTIFHHDPVLLPLVCVPICDQDGAGNYIDRVHRPTPLRVFSEIFQGLDFSPSASLAIYTVRKERQMLSGNCILHLVEHARTHS